jgi:hypothetical protein
MDHQNKKALKLTYEKQYYNLVLKDDENVEES